MKIETRLASDRRPVAKVMVNVRFTPDELERLDRARGAEPRERFMKKWLGGIVAQMLGEDAP